MSEQKTQPLTPGQKAIWDSFPVLPPPTLSVEERMQHLQELEEIKRLTTALDTANAHIESLKERLREAEWLLGATLECRSTLEWINRRDAWLTPPTNEPTGEVKNE